MSSAQPTFFYPDFSLPDSDEDLDLSLTPLPASVNEYFTNQMLSMCKFPDD